MKKRLVVVISVLLAATFLLAGCGEKICDHCGEKKKVKPYTISILGKTEENLLCQDCYEEFIELSEGFSKILGSIGK